MAKLRANAGSRRRNARQERARAAHEKPTSVFGAWLHGQKHKRKGERAFKKGFAFQTRD